MRIPILILLGLIQGGEVTGDLKQMQGSWVATHYVAEGKSWSEKDLKTLKLSIKGANGTLHLRDQIFHGSYKLDESTSPKTIDITLTEGPDKGKKKLGIYEIKGDTLYLCVGALGSDRRPTRFESKPGTGVWLEHWKRVK